MKVNIEKVVKFFDSRFIVNLANTFSFNKERIKKDQAIKEILEDINSYFKEHYIKKFIIAEEAKLMQKYYIKKKISNLRNEKAKEEYKNMLKKLDEIENNEEVIQFLCNYYLNDMAADFNPAFLIFFREMCKFLYKEFIKNLKIIVKDETIKFIKKVQGKNPIFFLPNHISNADHIPILIGINKKKLFHPVIVAGANLYRGVSKILLPKLNVEKLRRDFITDKAKWLNNPLYKLSFVKYNNYLWSHKEPFLFYIEGGRSRDGTIGEPKYGIISEIFNFIKEKNKTSYFIPITISYTIVPEDYELYEATKGKNITDNNLLTYLTKLNKEYKKFKDSTIYVKILEPIEVKPELKVDYKDFSKNIINILRKNIIITPTYLLAKILNQSDEKEIEKLEKLYNLESKTPYTENKFKIALNIFEKRKIIEIKNNYIHIIHKGLIKQYSNRIKYLT